MLHSMTKPLDEQGAPTPPAGVGPHEARELALMLAGKKPLAYFSELTRAELDWPDDGFAPYVAAGRIVKREYRHLETISGAPEEIRSLYYALPGEEWRIERAHRNRLRGYRTRDETEDDAREMGQLLGYSTTEVAAYLEWRDRIRKMMRAGT